MVERTLSVLPSQPSYCSYIPEEQLINPRLLQKIGEDTEIYFSIAFLTQLI
jgi:hypothetical protein